MMMFRTVKAALVDLLGDNAAARFQVVGYQRQDKSSGQVKDYDRMVQVYYSEGTLPKSAGRMRGHKSHDITIEIDMTSSAAAHGDVSLLTSETSTPAQKAAALAGIKEAAEIADTKIDELIEYVYQILMDARNEKLELATGDVSSRWIERIQKDTLLQHGDLIVKTANMKYMCRVQEDVLGAIGNEPATVVFSADTPIQDENESGTGVEIEIENTED
jgi:hypothetical protein